MAFVNMLPKTVNTTGASLTGTDGTVNRTYDLPSTGVLSSGIDVIINGTPLHEGASADFTMSGETITFLNIVDDTDLIRANYFVTVSSATATSITTSTSLKYATPLQLATVLGIKVDVPSWDINGTPTNEAVGTGDNAKTSFYLDHQNILSDSYTVYANAVAMTETTHYALDTTTGEITLTGAGVTLLSTTDITAKYSYISNGMDDDYLQAVLLRSQAKVDNDTNCTFTDGTVANPNYPSKEEYQDSQGTFNRNYFPENRPIIDISSTLASDITASDTTLDVASGDGDSFPSTGKIIIGSEIISYTGVSTDTLTGLTRGVYDSTAVVHTVADTIHTTIIESSATDEGSAPTYTPLAHGTDVEVRVDQSNFYIYRFLMLNKVYVDNVVESNSGKPYRIRINYLYGEATVPTDITRLTLLYAKSMLMKDTVSKAIVDGRDEFNPDLVSVDRPEINEILNTYRQLSMGNV